jgi:hypothetical protein
MVGVDNFHNEGCSADIDKKTLILKKSPGLAQSEFCMMRLEPSPPLTLGVAGHQFG